MNKTVFLPQNTFNFEYIINENIHIVSFDSKFDSGNCSAVQQVSPTNVAFFLIFFKIN